MKPYILLDTDRDYRDGRPLRISNQGREKHSAENRIQSTDEAVDRRGCDVGRVCGDVDSTSAPQAHEVSEAGVSLAGRAGPSPSEAA